MHTRASVVERCAGPGPGALYEGILTRRARVRDGGHRLATCLSTRLDDRMHAAAAGDAEAIHDVRADLNRLRALLRVLRKPLRETSAFRLEKDLRDFRARLGAERDHDVWLAFLASERVKTRCGVDPAFAAYRERQQTVPAVPSGVAPPDIPDTGAYRALMRRVATLLCREWPAGRRPTSLDQPWRSWLAARLLRGYQKLLTRRVKACTRKPSELHALRKRCRRLRYLAEFAAPLHGRTVSECVVRLNTLTRALGSAHDMDVFTAARAVGDVPAAVTATIKAARVREVRRARRAWEHLVEPTFKNRLCRVLKRAAGKG